MPELGIYANRQAGCLEVATTKQCHNGAPGVMHTRLPSSWLLGCSPLCIMHTARALSVQTFWHECWLLNHRKAASDNPFQPQCAQCSHRPHHAQRSLQLAPPCTAITNSLSELQ
jgi:hypothetical protein